MHSYFNWTPNWIESVYEGKFVEFPAYSPECEKNPAWGINSDFIHDCGNPKDGWLKKAAWPAMEKTWNCAYRALQAINFTNRQIASASSLVDLDGQSIEQAATTWMTSNKDVWTHWVPGDCSK